MLALSAWLSALIKFLSLIIVLSLIGFIPLLILLSVSDKNWAYSFVMLGIALASFILSFILVFIRGYIAGRYGGAIDYSRKCLGMATSVRFCQYNAVAKHIDQTTGRPVFKCFYCQRSADN